MNELDELQALRRMAELEAKEKNVTPVTSKFTPGPEGFAQSVREELASRNDPLGRFAMGVSGVVDDAAMRLKQLAVNRPTALGRVLQALGVSGALTPEEQQAAIGNRVNRESLEGLAGALTGGMALFGGPVARVGSGIARVAAPVVSRVAAPTVGGAAAGGMMADLTTPVLPGESENRNVGIGAAGGAAGDVIARTAGRAFQAVRPTPQAGRLMDEGIQLTPGQAAGANSTVGRIEQGLMSIPLVGDIIRHARGRATEDLNVAAIRRALPQNQQGQINQAGRESVDRAHRLLSQGYDDVLTRIGTVTPDNVFTSQLNAIARDPDIALSQDMRARFIEIIQQQFGGRASNSADLAKRIDSNLGVLARRYANDRDGDTRALGWALQDAQGAWKENISRVATGQDAATLRELNNLWGNLRVVERAAGQRGAKEGVFSAANLGAAVRQNDRVGVERNRARLLRMADDAESTMSQTVPDSGTTGRALLAALALGGAGGANSQFNDSSMAPFVTGALLSPLLYSRAGSAFLTGQATPALGALARDAAPLGASLGALLHGYVSEPITQLEPLRNDIRATSTYGIRG